MLEIRPEQLVALAADLRERYERQVARLLMQRYAPPVPPPRARVRAFVTRAVALAHEEGFTVSDDITLFVCAAWRFGEDFHRHAPFRTLDHAARVRWLRRALGGGE